MGKKTKILITVKTYPIPSSSHLELVCTVGVLKDGTFVRLYPIDYRYRPYWQWYKKYQWIELEIERNEKDSRPESFKPVDTAVIKTIGEPLSTKKQWAERKRYVLAKGTQTMCALQTKRQEQCSLGITRPERIVDFVIEPAERNWKPKWKVLFDQQRLFGPGQKPLEKIPYKFSYVFDCGEPSCNGHKMMIEDWELGQLYRAMRDKYQDEQVATEKVKDKFFGKICAPDIDTHFYVGTILQHGTWVILGTFWPKKVDEN